MTPEYQFYHGAFLHELIVAAGHELRIALRDFHGRPDAFVINGEVGVMIKHSTARLTPWLFSFAKEHIAEVHALRESTRSCFIVFVCGDDGFVCVRERDLSGLFAPAESNVVSVRVDRRPRKMYRVSSSGNCLDRKVPNGVEDIILELAHTAAPQMASAFSAWPDRR